MKKQLLAFSLVAVVLASFLAGCGDDDGGGGGSCEASAYVGTDTGSHKIFVNGIPGSTLGLGDIQDTLTITDLGSNKVNIFANSLSLNLPGTLNANCSVTLDSVIFEPGDTIFINSATFGQVKIFNVRAGGSGSQSGNTVSTSIKIKKGNTNLALLPNLQNVELKGTFKGVP